VLVDLGGKCVMSKDGDNGMFDDFDESESDDSVSVDSFFDALDSMFESDDLNADEVLEYVKDNVDYLDGSDEEINERLNYIECTLAAGGYKGKVSILVKKCIKYIEGVLYDRGI
jgi:hypothetical protein